MPSNKATFSTVVSKVKNTIQVPKRVDADLTTWRKLTEEVIARYSSIPEKFELVRELAAMLYRVSRD